MISRLQLSPHCFTLLFSIINFQFTFPSQYKFKHSLSTKQMKSSNDNDSTPHELDQTLLKSKSPHGGTDVQSHVQLAARMSDSQHMIGTQKRDQADLKNDVSLIASQEGDHNSSQKGSLLNITGQTKVLVNKEHQKNDDSKSNSQVANNMNENSNEGAGGKGGSSPERKSQNLKPLMVQLFQMPEPPSEKAQNQKAFQRQNKAIKQQPAKMTQGSNKKGYGHARAPDQGQTYFEQGDQQAVRKAIGEVCVNMNQRKTVVDDLYSRGNIKGSAQTSQHSRPVEVPGVGRRSNEDGVNGGGDNYTQGANSRLQKITSLQEQIISAETKLINRPMDDGAHIVSSPKSIHDVYPKKWQQQKDFTGGNSSSARNWGENDHSFLYSQRSNIESTHRSRDPGYNPQVPRVLQIEHRVSNSPHREKVEKDVDAKDHSLYTKYPAAPDHHHFQNIGQAFDNRMVHSIKHNRKFSQPIQSHTDQQIENWNIALSMQNNAASMVPTKKLTMQEREDLKQMEHESFNFFKSTLIGKQDQQQKIKKKDKTTPFNTRDRLPKISDAITPIVGLNSDIRQPSNINLDQIADPFEKELIVDPITKTESGPLSQKTPGGVQNATMGSVEQLEKQGWNQHVQIIQRNSQQDDVETIFQRNQFDLKQNIQKQSIFGQTGPNIFKAKVSNATGRSGVHTSDHAAKNHRRHYSNVVSHGQPDSSVSGLINTRPMRNWQGAQNNTHSMMIEAKMQMNKTGGSMDQTYDTMTSLARINKDQMHSSKMVSSNTWQGQQRFSYLKALNKQDEKKGAPILEGRENQQFLPYFVERDELGNLLKPPYPQMRTQGEDAKRAKSQKNAAASFRSDDDNIPETASQCSTDSKKERFMRKKLNQLEDFNLNRNLKRALEARRNVPAKQSTFKNLDKTKRNANLKILKQLKFSNKTNLKFENPDLKMNPDILNNKRFASKLDSMDRDVAGPEETFREHDSFAKSMKTTARNQEQQALLGSTKYGTNISVTDQDGSLPEGVQQLKIPNQFHGAENLYGSSVQQNIQEAKKINSVMGSVGAQSPAILTDRPHHKEYSPDDMESLNTKYRTKNELLYSQQIKAAPSPDEFDKAKQTFQQPAKRITVTKSFTGSPTNPITPEMANMTKGTAYFAPSQRQDKYREIEKQINLRNTHENYFKIKLPHSRAYLTNVDVANYNDVVRPNFQMRQYISDYVPPKKQDAMKSANKEKAKQQIQYFCPQGIEHDKNARLIPGDQMEVHLMKDQEFPTIPDLKAKIETNQVTTFSQAERFHDHKFDYSGYSMNLSAIDYNDFYKDSNKIRPFDKQFIRDDLFLSKAQVAVIEAKKHESKEKAIRMQKLKNDQEQKDKELEKQMGSGQQGANDLLEKGQQIRFQYSDHQRVMEMRPYINLMKDTIIVEARKRKLKNTEF